MPIARFVPLTFVAAAALSFIVCSGSTTATAPTSPTTPTAAAPTSGSAASGSLPAIYSKFSSSVRITREGATVVIGTTDVPDHPSPYFGEGSANYEAPQPGMAVNPNRIASQNITFRIPAAPVKGASSDTPLGAMGVATNGVSLFNQYAAGRVPLTSEIFSFDRYNGHPTPSNEYHYHVEPLWLTAKGKAVLVGVLLDGFPVYGPQDDGGGTPVDLDGCNGHIGATADYPAGTYHYHITSAPPYIAGCFYGVPGTVTGG